MSKPNREITHTIWTLTQITKNTSQWVELGTAREDEETGGIHAQCIVMPVNGFRGYFYLAPVGQKPPTIEPVVRRPGSKEEGESED